MLCDDLEEWGGGWEGGRLKKGGDIYIHTHIADSLCCTSEMQHCKTTIHYFKKQTNSGHDL